MRAVWVLLSLLLAAAGSYAEIRTWTDTQGREMKARLLHRGDGRITILRDDGQLFTVPLTMFSEEDRSYVMSWEPPVLEVPKVEDAVYVITTAESTGTGFLIQENGLVYLATNQHVIQGHELKDIEAKNAQGDVLKLGRLEVISDNDLARIHVMKDAGLKIAADLEMGSPVRAYGNSDGTGVLTINKGELVGLSETEVEVTTEIIPGNSGGPILLDDDTVIGVATYISTMSEEESKDWTVKDTRYAGTRRFGLRISEGMSWMPVTWDHYYTSAENIRVLDHELYQWTEIMKKTLSNPRAHVNVDNYKAIVLRDLAKEQNMHAKRFRTKIGRTISKDELNRMNRYENDKMRDRVKRSIDSMRRHMSGFRLANKIEVKYLEDQVDQLDMYFEAWAEVFMKEARKNRKYFSF